MCALVKKKFNAMQGELHSETVIPLFSQAVGDNRSGMLPFGSYRRNVSEVIDHHEFDDSKVLNIQNDLFMR